MVTEGNQRVENPPTLNLTSTNTSHQNTWDATPLNKLHEIAPIFNEPRTHNLNNRRDQSVFNKCRI